MTVINCIAATGERRHARDLYNPAVALLARTFRDRPVFPTAQFATPGWTEVHVPPPLVKTAESSCWVMCRE